MSGNIDALCATLREHLKSEQRLRPDSFTLTDAGIEAAVAFYRAALPRLNKAQRKARESGDIEPFKMALEEVANLASSTIYGVIATALALPHGDPHYEEMANVSARKIVLLRMVENSASGVGRPVTLEVPDAVPADGE